MEGNKFVTAIFTFAFSLCWLNPASAWEVKAYDDYNNIGAIRYHDSKRDPAPERLGGTVIIGCYHKQRAFLVANEELDNQVLFPDKRDKNGYFKQKIIIRSENAMVTAVADCGDSSGGVNSCNTKLTNAIKSIVEDARVISIQVGSHVLFSINVSGGKNHFSKALRRC